MSGDFVSARGETASVAVREAAGEARAGGPATNQGRATFWRHREMARTERLEEMQAQIADGTLIVRQMTAPEKRAASKDAERRLSELRARPARIPDARR